MNRMQTVCPDRAQLEACLLTSQDCEDSAIVEHLETCQHCRETLAELAGPKTAWRMARESLYSGQDIDLSHVSGPIRALPNHPCGSQADDPLAAHEIQQLKSLLDTPSHPELLGRIGRYEIEQLVERGGMGLVFRAYDSELHRVVAIKTLGLHLAPIGAARERFVREARACAALSHPHIVPMHDVITDGPIPALVMQYIAGPTLDCHIDLRGPLPWQQTLQIAIQLAHALCAAHAQGLVHRDIKPGNVMLEADASRALLMDFGLVRILDDATLTHSGVLAGTPQFMSPEQARGESVDERSDLFALGSLIYYMATGHAPFRADQPMAVLNRICNDAHRPLSEVQPEVPLELSRVVDRLLAKHPKHRYQTAAELRESLLELARLPRRLGASQRFKLRPTVGLASLLCGGSLIIAAAYWTFSENGFFANDGFSLRSVASAGRGQESATAASSTGLSPGEQAIVPMIGDRFSHARDHDEWTKQNQQAHESLERLEILLRPMNTIGNSIDDPFESLKANAMSLETDLNALEAMIHALGR